VVFQDQRGDYVILDPNRTRPLGAPAQAKRPPTIYEAITEEEMDAIAEAVFYQYERYCPLTRQRLSLIERVEEARGRAGRLPKGRKAA